MTRQELADKCLVELVRHVLASQGCTLTGITYEELARRIQSFNKHGEPHPRLGAVLGVMGHLLEAIQPDWQEPIPHIQALVVTKNGDNRGIPDDGISEFRIGYDRLTRTEKENKAFAEWQVIADFGSRWNLVLQQLDLPTIVIDQKLISNERTRGAGGESWAHQNLKEFVKQHPELVGVDGPVEAFTEYALPSLDTLDVLFKTPKCWTAVEVKSSISDGVPSDYQRGLYQIVKYTALLHAMRTEPQYAVPGEIKVLLVLESTLPTHLLQLRDRLQIQVIEGVKP
jgi:hypothetical protein